METSEHLWPAKRKRPAPPLPTAPGPLPKPVPDNTHSSRSPVVLDTLPDGIVVDSIMKDLARGNEALRDGLRPKDEEAADIDKLPSTLANAASDVSTPVRQPDSNADKQTLHMDRQQVEILQQQLGGIETMPVTRTQGTAPADESAVMQLLREIQQQQIEMQAALQQQIQRLQADLLAALQQQHEQYKADSLAALHKQNQQHQVDMLAALREQNQQQQSVQNTALERRELELLRAARMQDGEMSRDMEARAASLRERVSGLEERSQQITMRERELRERLESEQMT